MKNHHLIICAMLAFLLINKSARAFEEWESNWVFKEAPILLEQLGDACTLLNAKTDKAVCYQDLPMAIIVNVPIDYADSVDAETAELRFDIRRIQLLAMNVKKDVLMVDKSKAPHMAGLYGFATGEANYNARLQQKSYSTLESYCANFKIQPWFCNSDQPTAE